MATMKLSLRELAKTTQDVYERNAARFDNERPKDMHERIWIDRFLDPLPKGGRVLDLGCGAAEPIGAYMAELGYSVIGIDASTAMIDIARTRAPEGDWRLADMRNLNLPERFHGIIGWNSFFHLTREEQRQVLPRLAAHLLPSGVLMLTVGPEDGEVDGHVGDDAVYHSSLALDEYKSILLSVSMEIVDFVAEDPNCDFQTVLMARKLV